MLITFLKKQKIFKKGNFTARVITIAHFDKAAFYTSLGANLNEVTGSYPNNRFVLQIPYWLIIYERLIGFVSYRRFCNQRIRLKRKTRKLAGLPEKFTGSDGDHTGFRLGDIAHFRYDKRMH